MDIDLRLKIEGYTEAELERYREIFYALIKSGGLSGVKGGSTSIHFNGEGEFVGVQLNYWPWRKLKSKR